ncbi:sensor domain-containing diguanylate cyclase [Pollutimonas bauzanensis]|uniref:PAS domain S-box-containing protein/diguanylate cyclase (GGDEF) domain-containing protein n=1 Tax=Pollutimonas bauzanensis TaxID=658167 RepID=A0A1M5TLR8_9BURK|nr:diguanylate cyclase [Pollutimonas bauzanensis]SHH51628.1 PAS domain S-box-containing protein/diguanylate cyclase (GGDEF) domain-containing protein [Pollutimonas bauzanensis]
MTSNQIHTLRPIDIPAGAPDERFDGLTRLARRHLGVAIALIFSAETDRRRLRSCDGWDFGATPPDLSAFAQAAQGATALAVPDTLADQRLRGHPLVLGRPFIRFSAACPLLASSGGSLGDFFLFDKQPRQLDDEQLEFLRDLARLASAAIEHELGAARLENEEHILRESERRMALAIAQSGTGIWDRNVQTNEIYYSAGWKAILGYEDSELSNLVADSYTRVHPDDLAYVQATIQDHFERKTASYEVEHRLRCKDGGYKWVSSRGKVTSRDSDGKPLRMIGTTTDITAMRAMSDRLRQTADLITSLTNEVPGLVFQYRRLAGGESFFSYASAGIRDMYELEPDQLAASAAALERIIHPDDLPAYHASLDTSAACLAPWHLEYRVQLPRQGLRWRQAHARPRRLEDGGTLWHGFITDVTERKRIEAELQEFATTDFLTQLPNRRYFMAQAEAELARIRRDNGKSAAVLMCDLDHFKSINDKWGHTIGDLALRQFAAILGGQLRKTDVAGRVGGEEFAVMLRGADYAEAAAFARRLQQRIAAAPLLMSEQPIVMTVSVGIAAMNASDADADLSLARSDMALYRAKEGGRNRIECH